MSDIINIEEGGDMDIIPIFGSTHAVDFHDEESREEFNDLFDSITDEARNPQIIYSELSGLLSSAGYVIPTGPIPTEVAPDDEKIFALHFSEEDERKPVYFYFAHSVVYEDGGSEIHAELLSEEELENLFEVD